MQWSIRALLGWMVIAAILAAIATQLFALAVFLFTIMIPIAFWLHTPIPSTLSRRVFYGLGVFAALLPLYLASIGPLIFVSARYEFRPEKDREWLSTIGQTVFAPAEWIYSKMPETINAAIAEHYCGEWLMYGYWYFDTVPQCPWIPKLYWRSKPGRSLEVPWADRGDPDEF